MRIIAGKYARREFELVGKTRPPLLRIRQCIFDVIETFYDLYGATVLDLCAGSGSLGLEALSRGAGQVYFFEENIDTAKNIMTTLKKWEATNGKVVVKNVQYLPKADEPVDIIFFDPPFGHNYIEKIQTRLIDKGWTHENTLLMVRTDHKIEAHPMWMIEHEKEIGISRMYFFRSTETPSKINELII